MAFGRLELIAIGAILVGGLLINSARLAGEVADAEAHAEKLAGDLQSEREARHAAELGAAVAAQSRERVREVVRTVQLPPVSAACRDDPAVGVAYDAIRRMRNAFKAGEPDPAPGAPPPTGS